MPYNILEVREPALICLESIFLDLEDTSKCTIYKPIIDELTIGSHPTRLPPPRPFPFLTSVGSCAQRAMTGYPFVVPKDERFVLSA